MINNYSDHGRTDNVSDGPTFVAYGYVLRSRITVPYGNSGLNLWGTSIFFLMVVLTYISTDNM